MEPAASIISALGGPTAIADVIGLHRTRVSMWQAPREKGGTNGMIPYRHIGKLMKMAQDRDIKLGPADFLQLSPSDAA